VRAPLAPRVSASLAGPGQSAATRREGTAAVSGPGPWTRERHRPRARQIVSPYTDYRRRRPFPLRSGV